MKKSDQDRAEHLRTKRCVHCPNLALKEIMKIFDNFRTNVVKSIFDQREAETVCASPSVQPGPLSL